jgi:hypothetical protein
MAALKRQVTIWRHLESVWIKGVNISTIFCLDIYICICVCVKSKTIVLLLLKSYRFNIYTIYRINIDFNWLLLKMSATFSTGNYVTHIFLEVLFNFFC